MSKWAKIVIGKGVKEGDHLWLHRYDCHGEILIEEHVPNCTTLNHGVRGLRPKKPAEQDNRKLSPGRVLEAIEQMDAADRAKLRLIFARSEDA